MTDTPRIDDDMEERTDDDIAGVQGSEGAPDEETGPGTPGETPDAPAPDAGEIEWAGGAIRKPPAPAA